MKTAEEILQTLTLEEKASLCQGASFWFTKEITEKGVPAIMMTDGPHGLRKQTGETDHLGINKSVPATCFPSSAAVCNSWDETLMRQIGAALGQECKQEQVAVLLGPGANLKRSPLCGRNFEYFSEDPYLSSNMAKSHIQGVQSQGVGTSLKHFALNNQETRRMTVDVRVDERTLRETYLASFETAVKEGKPWTIMGAYNKVNGTYCCENSHLLRDILRGEWGYEGVVVSDWGAANDDALGIAAGFDLRMPYAGEVKTQAIVQAVQEGQLDQRDLDAAVLRLLKLALRGEANRCKTVRYDVAAHHELAIQAAAESAVLLKNEGGVLPLAHTARVAVIGGLAKTMRYQGGGSSHVNPTFHRDLLTVLAEDYPDVKATFARGYRLKKDEVDEDFVSRALANAAESDVVVYCMGMPNGWESEGFDRTHLRLPGNQIDLLNRLAALGKPVVVFLFTGAPVLTDWAAKADALFAMYTAGQGVAEAMARLLFGRANPCGKLAETWPLALEHTPCSLTYPQKETAVYEEGVFVGYRYYDKKQMPVAYPFGFGLSYTDWQYSNLRLDKQHIRDTDTLTVQLDVTNTGRLPGKEIVELYVGNAPAGVPRPVKELRGFTKVFCTPGQTQTVTFTLNKRSFAYYHVGMHDWYAESGTYEILAGASSRDIRLRATVRMEATQVIPKTYDRFVTMGELMTLPAGQAVVQEMMAAYQMPAVSEEERQRRLNDEEDTEDVAMDYAAMGMDMPLCKVADMSGGAMTEETVRTIVAALNQ
jgi:beta-glucosidase